MIGKISQARWPSESEREFRRQRRWRMADNHGEMKLPRFDSEDPIEFLAAVQAEPSETCSVPGCTVAPLEPRIPLCGDHRRCPRCGLSIDDAPRVSLSCCGFLVAMIPRRAYTIPWMLALRALQTTEAWPHRMIMVKLVVRGRVIAEGLPWLEEEK